MIDVCEIFVHWYAGRPPEAQSVKAFRRDAQIHARGWQCACGVDPAAARMRLWLGSGRSPADFTVRVRSAAPKTVVKPMTMPGCLTQHELARWPHSIRPTGYYDSDRPIPVPTY